MLFPEPGRSSALLSRTQRKPLLPLGLSSLPLPFLWVQTTWTVGIPGLQHLGCIAMVCLFIHLDDQTLGSVRKRPCLAHMYTVVPNRGRGTLLVLEKPLFGKR